MTSYRYRTGHPEAARFQGRRAYLKKWVPKVTEPRLCEVMERHVERPSVRRTKSTDPWSGFPWLTFVLGSGCLELPAEPGYTPAKLANAVAALLDDEDWPEGSESMASLVKTFTESLVGDRLGDRGSPVDEAEPKVGLLAARFCLIATLLTRLFHTVRAATPVAFSRSGHDTAEHDRAEGVFELRDIDRAVIEPLVHSVSESLRVVEPRQDDAVWRAVGDLLKAVLVSLRPSGEGDPAVVHLDHVRLMSEVAWHFLVRESSIYPGWNDLLLDLMLQEGQGSADPARLHRPSRPDIINLPDAIERLLGPAMQRSWSLMMSDEGAAGPRSRPYMYQAAAEVLVAQTEAIRAQPASDRTSILLPPPVAFVTSFDLEMEMALAKRGEPHFVAMPVHVFVEGPEDAELCWLLGEVEASASDGSISLDDVRFPRTWQVLGTVDEKRLRTRPVVVHLSGCPLIKLPSLDGPMPLADGLERVGIRVDVDQSFIAHAVTVDEYLSLCQTETEMLWFTDKHRDAKARQNRGLPDLLRSDAPANRRFWMAMGVPVGDPAVRHRLLAQITARRLRSTTADPVARESVLADSIDWLSDDGDVVDVETPPGVVEIDALGIDGVAVNKRIDQDETILLNSLGLDVVQEDCRAFLDDLHHYAAHVRAVGPAKRVSWTTGCRLK